MGGMNGTIIGLAPRDRPMPEGWKTSIMHSQPMDLGQRIALFIKWPDGTQRVISYKITALLDLAGLDSKAPESGPDEHG